LFCELSQCRNGDASKVERKPVQLVVLIQESKAKEKKEKGKQASSLRTVLYNSLQVTYRLRTVRKCQLPTASRAEADAEAEIDGGVAGTELGMWGGEVRLTAEAGGRPSVARIPIACIGYK
jgi:hypothetical protein